MPRSVQVLDRRRVRDAGVGAAQLLGDARVGHRQALDVGLVDDRLVVRRLRRAVDAPVEVRVDDDGLRHVRRRVVVVALLGLEVVAEDRRVPVDLAVDGLGVRVEQQLVRVAAQALGGVVGAVHAEAVALAGVDAGQEGVPDVAVHLGEPDALLVALVVEEAQLDLLGHLAEDREVRAGAVVRGPEGVGAAGPDLGHLGCSSCCGAPRRRGRWPVRTGCADGRSGGAAGGRGARRTAFRTPGGRVRRRCRRPGRRRPRGGRGGRRAHARRGGPRGASCRRSGRAPGSDLAREIPGGAGPRSGPLLRPGTLGRRRPRGQVARPSLRLPGAPVGPGEPLGPVLSHPRRTVVPCARPPTSGPPRGASRVVSDFEPSGDQPAAIKAARRAGERGGDQDVVLLGATGTGKSATTAWLIEQVQRPDAGHGAEQDARRAAGQRVPRAAARTTPSSTSSRTTTTTSPRPTSRRPTPTSRRTPRSTTRSSGCGTRRRRACSPGATSWWSPPSPASTAWARRRSTSSAR